MADYMTSAELKNADLLKVVIVQALVDEGYLDHKQGKEFIQNYGVIIASPSWFESVYKSLFPGRKDGSYYNVVKFVSGEKKQNNTEEEEEESISELKFQLSKAESEENYVLAQKLRDKINKLEGKKK